MSELPKNWEPTKLGHVTEFVYGKGLTKTKRKNCGTYPVYGSNGAVGYHDEFLVKGPVVIVGRKGAAGVPTFSTDNCWPIDTTYYVQESPAYDLKFMYYLLQSLRLDQFDRSTAIPGLNRDDAYALDIGLPPINEQNRIVAKIEELFSELDKAIENLKTARQQLKIYRQAVLKHVFEGKFIKKTTVWSKRSVKQITTYITSGSRGWARYYADSGDLFIRAQNLKFDRLDLTDIAFVNIPNNAEGTRTKIQKGDLLITITGANVTKAALVESEIGAAYVSQHVALCRPTDEVFPKFLYWFMVAESAGRKQLNTAAYGAGKPGLNLDNIKGVNLLLPRYEEQVSIVEIIEEKFSVCDNLDKDLQRQINNCTALRHTILKRAFSGKLVAQDPKDEPASVLLERIKAEKSGTEKRRNAA